MMPAVTAPANPQAVPLAQLRSELVDIIARRAPCDGSHPTPIPRVSLHRYSGITMPEYRINPPALTVLAQGSKAVVVGGRTIAYDAEHYLVTAVDVPVIAQVTGANAALPYLCITLDLDAGRIASLLADLSPDGMASAVPELAVAATPIEPLLFEALLRMARLLDAPHEIEALASVFEREIHYRLLTGVQAARIRQMTVADSQSQQVTRAILWIREHLDRDIRIDALARIAGMSASALHAHFKAVTALTPMRYQKHLRLREARRLMMVELLDAGMAGHRVGYRSASHFSRDYRRLYGAPPVQDVMRVRRV